MTYSEKDEGSPPKGGRKGGPKGEPNGGPKGGRWDDFRYFLAVAKTTSIKRAAAELGTTQSAVSKRLDRLERDLRVRLIDRGPTGTVLTYQGERVLNHTLSAHSALSRAHGEARAAEHRIEGDCSLLLGDGLANYWLPPFLDVFFDLHPNIELKVILDHDLSAPRNEVFDIRLHYHEPADPAQISRPLANVHFVPFASKAYIAKHGKPASTEDLVHHRLMDQSQYLVAKGSWAAWFGDNVVKSTSLFTNHSAFLARSVHAGIGIALMPTYVTLADESFVPLDIGMRFSVKLFASYHRERALKLPVRTMLKFLKTKLFDPKTMPWFAPEFVAPDPSWREAFAEAIARARAANMPDVSPIARPEAAE
ncbi:MAG: LysR family transcriptional regulator [Proteobacteria bacterium]|nr:LysR family transcriptional regulator [Pseudomonadota bacterium]